MIDKNSFEQAIPLAAIYAGKGIKVLPVTGTPFEKLVSANTLLTAAVAVSGVDGEDLSLTENEAGYMSEESDNPSHNSYFDEMVSQLSTSVSVHISNAKNIIAPLVTEASERIIDRMKAEIETEPTYKIIQVGLPEPMKNEGFKETILKASGGINADPEKYLKLPAKTPQEIQEMLLTGSGDFDEKIKIWFLSKGDSFFDNVWKNSFMDVSVSEVKDPCGLLTCFRDKKDGSDYALAVFFLARRLINVVAADSGMTLAEYTKIVTQYLDVAAVKLAQDYQINESIIKSDALVTEHNERKMEVTVNETTYLKYIQGGGKNEVIFGALVSNAVPYLTSALAGKEQEFQTAWERFSSFSKNTVKNKAFVTFKDICVSVLLAQFAEPTEIEKERELTNPGMMVEISRIVSDYVSGLSILSMSDPHTVALHAVASIRFHYTDAFKFLNSINEVCKQNPSIDVREAALIATVEYTTDYVCGQMRLV